MEHSDDGAIQTNDEKGSTEKLIRHPTFVRWINGVGSIGSPYNNLY